MDKFLLKSSISEPESRKRPADELIFSLPKKTASRQKIPTKQKLNIENRFSNLPPDETLDPEAAAFKEASTVKKSNRIPPIIISIKEDWTHATIKDLVNKFDKSFTLQYRGNNKVAVLCSSANSHQLIKQGLINDDAFFHTYTRKDEKNYKVVILGLPPHAEDELSEELNSLGFKDISVMKLKTAANKSITCPPYLIQLPPGSDIYKFRQIKYLCRCVIEIRKYRKNYTLGSQCFRCQAFGHASRNCNMPARCVKCTGNHSTKECSKKNPEEKAKCCNCGLDHPANYSKCTERQKYLDKIKEKNAPQIKTYDKDLRSNFPHSSQIKSSPLFMPKINDRPTISKPSWAQVTKSTRYEQPIYCETRYPSMETLPTVNNFEDKDTMEILEILKAIKAVKAQLTASSTIFDKVYLVLTYLGRYVQ